MKKILIIHDQMLTKGGSERVFTYLADTFSSADLFTLTYNKKTSLDFSRSNDLKVSKFFNFLIRNSTTFKFLFPLTTYYFQFKNFKDYDLIISSSATCAKYIRNFSGKHICYCYVPTRAIWEIDNYFPKNSIIKTLFKFLLPYFKSRDLKTANYIDLYIGDSKDAARRIKKTYFKNAKYAFSPINFEKYSTFFSNKKEDYFLIVSRLDYWKRVDIAIDVFNKNGKKLIVVGSGEAYTSLKRKAKDNIIFLNHVSDDELGSLYSRAKCLIFTPDIEHGLIPIEANACGTPVVCYGAGGVLDTMINYNGSNKEIATAVFFDKQNAESLNCALEVFDKVNFNYESLRKNAERFSIPSFQSNMKKIISKSFETNY